MQLIRGLTTCARGSAGCVVTIGTYDGMHLGHQALIARLQSTRRAPRAPTVLLTFEPMPREYLAPEDPPARLTSLRERWRILAPLGARLHLAAALRRGVCVTCRRTASRHCWRAICRRAVVVVGHDFRFGRTARPRRPCWRRPASGWGLRSMCVPPVTLDGERVSSSARARGAGARRLRAARSAGWADPIRCAAAWCAAARLGRELGFPTANLPLERRRRRSPGSSRCACTARGAGALPGVASLGTRPTVGGD